MPCHGTGSKLAVPAENKSDFTTVQQECVLGEKRERLVCMDGNCLLENVFCLGYSTFSLSIRTLLTY